MSSKDTDGEHQIHSKSDNIAIKVDNEADEVINNLFESLLSRYEIGLDILIKDSVLYLIILLHCTTKTIK